MTCEKFFLDNHTLTLSPAIRIKQKLKKEKKEPWKDKTEKREEESEMMKWKQNGDARDFAPSANMEFHDFSRDSPSPTHLLCKLPHNINQNLKNWHD